MTADKMTPNFLLFGGALLMWAAAVGLSSHLAQSAGGSSGVRGGSAPHSQSEPVALPPELAAQRDAVNEHPDDRARRLAYAENVHQAAVEGRDTQLLMEAVSQYQTLLQRDANDADALLGLAHLCFEASIVDKAVELFPKYLALRPEDHRARIEYALASLQSGDAARAETEVDTVLRAEPKLFQARVTRALLLKVQGKAEESAKEVEQAKALAPSDDDRRRIDEFIARVGADAAGGGGPGSESAPARDQISPGTAVVDYFRNHPIIGKKIRSIQWPDAATAVIAVENFPVEQMPPFAREKFLSNAKQALGALPTKVTVKLVDADSSRELISIEAGGGG